MYHLYLGHTARSRRNTLELEIPKLIIVFDEHPLSLEHVHCYSRLIVRVGGENLTAGCQQLELRWCIDY